MKHILTVMVVIGLSATANADTFRPSRVRLLAHSSEQFNGELGASVHFIPAGNLLGGVVPLAYGCLDWTPIPELTISPAVGWAFQPDELIVSLRLTPKFGKFWGWVDFEERPQSHAFYWFAQAQYQLSNFIHIGAEEESWGDFHDFGSASHGAGPNILMRFEKNLGIDLAMHARHFGDATKPEFFLRTHLFF